jgi:hypothetical protein
MYVKATSTEEKLIDLVKELTSHLEDVYICNGFDDDYGQKLCNRAVKLAEKADKRRNEIYKEKGE